MSELAIIPNLPTVAPLPVESSLSLLPRSVPRELAEHPDRDAVIRECRAVQAAEKPATPEQFVVTLAKFMIHYPESRLSPEEQRQMLADWRRLMGELPPDILQGACDAYVMSPARFFPTPGQLYAVADKAWSYRKRLARRADETLALVWGRAA